MLLESLTDVVKDGAVERWDEVFSFTVSNALRYYASRHYSRVYLRVRSFERISLPRIAPCARIIYRCADSSKLLSKR